MGIRSVLRNAAKPAAMVAVAGTVALSLIITTPSNAQAFVPPPVLPVVSGAAEIALGGFITVTPVGWAIIGTAALGVGLYATKDYWLPYVTGLFGSKDNNTANYGPPNASYTWHSIPNYPDLSPDKKTLTVGYRADAKSQDYQADYGVIGHCKNPTTGQVGYRFTSASQYINSGNKLAFTFNAVPCPVGYEIIGWIAGGGQGSSLGQYTPNLNTSDPNPVQMQGTGSQYEMATKNYWKGGDMGTPTFDPKSPDMKYRTEVECISDSGVKSTINAFSTGDKAGITMPSCAAAGKGHATGTVTVWATPPGTSTEQKIWSATAPAPDPATPLCSPTRSGSGCKLAVQLDGKPCVSGVFECENWTDLSKDPNYTNRLSCQYGPYSVPLSTCNPLERAYEPGGVPATEKNLDGDPNTKDDTQPDGSTTPKNNTTTGTVPGGGGAPAPAPAPTGSPEATAQECWPNGWAVFNPLEWILKPLGCAFIPKTDVQAKARELSDKVSGKAPVSWIVSPPPLLGPSGGSCPTWVVKVGDSFSQNAVCDSSFTAAIRSIRAPLFGIVAAAMVWPLIRSIWYAAIPILRVTPSSGGK